jgi:hypothetical protein
LPLRPVVVAEEEAVEEVGAGADLEHPAQLVLPIYPLMLTLMAFLIRISMHGVMIPTLS